jgi:hypothetical protein
MKRAAAVLLALLLFPGSATAQDDGARPSTLLPEAGLQHGFAIPGVEAVPGPDAAPSPSRPGALVPLYTSFVTLQALDVHSTWRALERGGVEANPLMKGIAGNPLALSAVKAAGAAGVIYAGEKIWKKNKAAAVLFMIAANAGMAFVVQHNYRVGRR